MVPTVKNIIFESRNDIGDEPLVRSYAHAETIKLTKKLKHDMGNPYQLLILSF